jgi:hypothetical protein
MRGILVSSPVVSLKSSAELIQDFCRKLAIHFQKPDF